MNRLVWGVFDSGEGARAGVEQLIEAHFPPDEIKVLMRDEEGFHDAPMHRKTAVPAGAALGAALGAAGAAGAVLVTGGGALLATGPAIALLQAVGMGGALGSIAGAMGGLSWWKDEPDVPEQADHDAQSHVLVLVPVPEERSEEAQAALRRASPERVGALDTPDAASAPRSESLAEETQQEQRQRGQQRDAE